MTRLLVIQPYIPRYRVAFFRDLRSGLASVGIDLILAAGRASGNQAARGDDVSTPNADWLLSERSLRVGAMEVRTRQVRELLESFRPNLIVAEQAIKNVDTWSLLLSECGGARVALWGHGALFSQRSHQLYGLLRRVQLRRADWFFSYTPAGTEYLVRQNFPTNRITTLFNSSDSAGLQRDISQLGERESHVFRERYDLTSGHTGLFIGGIDQRKGIDFLLQTVSEVARVVPTFRLLIAGSGADEQVQAAQDSGLPVRLLGPLEGASKALAFANCDFVLIPEWVGLAAVDALAAGRPVVTTDHPSHAPEFDYLVQNQTKVQSSHDVNAYSSTIVKLIADPDWLGRLQKSCAEQSSNFSIERMSRNFIRGIESWRDAPRKG
jgi:glycosyltransferase involved in cell wall biosynthesis